MVQLSFWHVLALMGLVWLSAISGVIIGATFVFKTKREPHETLWSLQKPKGQAFNLKDDTDLAGVFPNQGDDNMEVPGAKENAEKRLHIVGKMNDLFMRKLYGDKIAKEQVEETEETGT